MESHKTVVKAKGEMRFDFDALMMHLKSYKLNFNTLNFSMMLFNDAVEKGVADKSYDKNYVLYHGSPLSSEMDGTKFREVSLQKDVINDYLKENINHFGNIQDVLKSLTINNAHFLRSKFVNSIFEILKKYVDKHNELSGKNNFLKKRTSKTGLVRNASYFKE